MNIEIWADGASCGNSLGPGGWCALLKVDGEIKHTAYGGSEVTTNNVMELQAVVGGLEMLIAYVTMHGLPPCIVTVHTDSYYVAGAFIEDRITNWINRGWRHKGGLRPNYELWQYLLQVLESLGKLGFVTICGTWQSADGMIIFQHVEGHAGIPENEYCDKVAKSMKQRIKQEVGYSGRG